MNLLLQLTRKEQARLLEELNYMNLAEIHGFCGAHGIPYRIVAEDPAKKLRATVDTDRKPIVLAGSAAISEPATPVSPLASRRRSSAPRGRRHGSDLAIESTIAGTRRSTRASPGCCAA